MSNWTTNELARLKELCDTCNTWEEIAEAMSNRTINACSSEAHRNGIVFICNRQDWWTDDEILQLVRMREEGITFKKIAGAIGRSEQACVKKANRLGLPKKTMKGACK